HPWRITQFNKEFCVDVEKNVLLGYKAILPLKTRYEPTSENDLMLRGLDTYERVLNALDKAVTRAANPPDDANFILFALQRLKILDPKTLLTDLQNAAGLEPPKTVFEKAIDWLNSAIRNERIKLFNYAEFTELMDIGHGGFGESIKPQEGASKEDMDILVREIKMLHTLNYHDNVIRFHGVSYSNYNAAQQTHYLVMQYANGGTLRSYLRMNFDSLTWQDKRRIAEEIANGLY
ncbi:13653_t:CDS:2, partial [Ambispora leptoticha]